MLLIMAKVAEASEEHPSAARPCPQQLAGIIYRQHLEVCWSDRFWPTPTGNSASVQLHDELLLSTPQSGKPPIITLVELIRRKCGCRLSWRVRQ